jgi:hypothetical protein
MALLIFQLVFSLYKWARHDTRGGRAACMAEAYVPDNRVL